MKINISQTFALSSACGKWVMASGIMASAMAFIDGTALNVVLPSLQKSLNASGPDLFWILNAYLLMLAALILVGGAFGDLFGRKKIFMLGIFVFISGSAACGFSNGIIALIAFRAIQGIGGSLMIPGSLALISASINKNERGRAIGIWSSITTVVTIGGPVLGGVLADAGLWRYIFFINFPIGIAALLILWKKVPESRNIDGIKVIDYSGALTIVCGLAIFTFGILRIPETGLSNWLTLSSLSGGTLFLIFFGIIESKSKHAMMPFSLFSNRTFSGANALTFFLYGGLSGATLFLSLNFVQIQGYNQFESGITFLPFTVIMIAFARFAGRLADRFGSKYLLMGGPFTAGCGLIILSYVGQTAGPADYWVSFFPGILVFALGMAFTIVPLTTAVMGSVTDDLTGTASGVNNAITRIAGVLAYAIFGALIVLLFTGNLTKNISKLALEKTEKVKILAEAPQLGNAKVSVSFKRTDAAIGLKAIHDSFISSYEIIMKISALLAFLASAMAFFFIHNKEIVSKDTHLKHVPGTIH